MGGDEAPKDFIPGGLSGFCLYVGSFFAFFCIFSHFGRILNHHGIFGRLFSIFFDFLPILDGFGEDFGRVLEGFFDVFSICS